MSRLTITLTDARYRALKEASVQRNKTIGQLIEEGLEFYGIKTRENAQALVQRARIQAGLSEAQAMDLAGKEVKFVRKNR
ncbi:MAG: CopG family transcriptional regulator [Acidiferrobacter sp.]